MRKKKYIAKISVLCLMLAMLFPTTTFAASAADSTTKLQTTVPKTHTVRLEIGEHGSVTVGKETYTGTKEILVNRLSEVSYKIKADGKYEIETVTYDGADVTDQLRGKSYHAAPINKDGIVFKVTFRDKKGGSDSQTDGTTGTNGSTKNPVKTGDETNLALWTGIIGGSALLVVFLATKAKRKYRNTVTFKK